MSIWEAILLGVVQGLTEFLPVSSSGHLALGQALLGIDTGDVTFEVIVHFGTLLAVITVLRRRIWSLIQGILSSDPASFKTVGLLVIGSIPAAFAGIFLEDRISSIFASPLTVSIMLIVTGGVLFSTRNRLGETSVDKTGTAFAVGVAQALAILPGISRSGMTIATGMWFRVEAGEAAAFSFLMAIPIIAGATALKVGHLVSAGPGGESVAALVAGAIAAYASGVLSIRWLLSILGRGELSRFAYYCWAVGIIGTIAYWT